MNSKFTVRFVVLVSFIVVYLSAGIYDELVFIQKKPLPEKLLSDYRLYQSAHSRATAGDALYDGVFLYPPPSLLIVGLFGHISNTLLQYSVYLAVNILLISILVYGISHMYAIPIERIWYWFPLVFGYAPLFESLHFGQINVIAAFGIFLLFYAGQQSQMISGLGLSLAIVTKFSPLVFIGYLGLTRQYKVLGWMFVFLGLFSGVALARYGLEPFRDYPLAVSQLMDRFSIDVNTHSFVSKLGTLNRTELMNWSWMRPVMDWLQPVQKLTVESPQVVQNALLAYFGLILAVSGFIAFKQFRRDEFFIVTSLCVLLYPNLVWYHHYVFLILPLLIWMASTKLNPWVVAWCLAGLFIVQLDRWHLTYGLLIHMFGHGTLWIILYKQIKSSIGSLYPAVHYDKLP